MALLREARAAWGAVDAAREVHAAYLAGFEDRLRALAPLSDDEVALLRRSTNPAHVARARALGVGPLGSREAIAEALAAGLLVDLQSAPGYAVSRGGRYSLPYGTPDAAAGLDLIAERFGARLAEAGLPQFRYTVTSVLRSSEDQQALRQVNRNAAAGRSSHEFGTTFDITYRRFAYAGGGAPLPPSTDAVPRLLRAPLDALLAADREAHFRDLAARYPTVLAAELGRALIALEDEGALITVREVQQPVYHVTVARPLATDAGAGDMPIGSPTP